MRDSVSYVSDQAPKKSRRSRKGHRTREVTRVPETSVPAAVIEVKTKHESRVVEGSGPGPASAREAVEYLRERLEEEREAREEEHRQRIERWRRDLAPGTHFGHVPFDHPMRMEYLAALEATGVLVKAADAVGVHPDTVRRVRAKDPDFNHLCEVALERYRAWLIGEAERRAIHGVEEPVYQQGEFVGHKRVYSDRLLEVLLKAKAGSEFRDKVDATIESKNTNVNVSTTPAKLAQMTPEQRQALRVVLGIPLGATSAKDQADNRGRDAVDTLGLKRMSVDDKGGGEGEGDGN